MNNTDIKLVVENNIMRCHCGRPMIMIKNTLLCPSCNPVQIEDMNWVIQHIEERKREGRQP